MQSILIRRLLIGAALVAFAACNKAPTADQNMAAADNSAAIENSSAVASGDPIQSAESAGPASVSKAAAIVEPQTDGSMKVLRAGSGAWTCMPDAPDTPGPDPMCFDTNAGKWADAWVH